MKRGNVGTSAFLFMSITQLIDSASNGKHILQKKVGDTMRQKTRHILGLSGARDFYLCLGYGAASGILPIVASPEEQGV